MEKTIKTLAKEAKSRLKNGYWQEYEERVEKAIVKAKAEGVEKRKVAEYFSYATEKQIKSGESDEGFYLKVKELLESEETLINPIGKLTDKEYFNTLDYASRQRYIFTLSEKFRRAQERYNKEKEVKFN